MAETSFTIAKSHLALLYSIYNIIYKITNI